MEDLQRAMSGGFFAGNDADEGERERGAESELRTGDSSEGRRGASPEKIWSAAALPSAAGRSGAEAEERRAAAAEITLMTGVFGERTGVIAWGATDTETATDWG